MTKKKIPLGATIRAGELYLPTDAIPTQLYPLLDALAKAASELSSILMDRATVDISNLIIDQNSDGDRQVALDVIADKLFYEAVKTQDVAWYASEEREDAKRVKKRGKYAVAIDPLDGSSNIDINMSVGSIFSIYWAKNNPDASFLRPPKEQVSSGYFIYGPQTRLMLTTGSGVKSYYFDLSANRFIMDKKVISVPEMAKEFAINMSNYHNWNKPIRTFIDDCIMPKGAIFGAQHNMRWIASLVAEAERILTRGGIFLYPSDGRVGYENGRLRMVYEVGAIAFLIEQAGGQATDGTKPIMEKTALHLHARTPFMFGSRKNVEQVVAYHDLPDHEMSALFVERGLFRRV